MKKSKKIIISICILIFFVAIIIIFSINNNIEKKNLDDEKNFYEIQYLDEKIFSIYKYFSQNNIDWEQMKIELNNIYSNWNSIIIELTNKQIKNTDLTNFGKILDEIFIAIENKNGDKLLGELSNIYSLLNIYAKACNLDEQFKNELNLKSQLLKAYSLINTNNWLEINNTVNNAEKIYYNYLNNVDNAIKDNRKTNIIYISIKELENSINLRNKEIFITKLKIVLEKF